LPIDISIGLYDQKCLLGHIKDLQFLSSDNQFL